MEKANDYLKQILHKLFCFKILYKFYPNEK